MGGGGEGDDDTTYLAFHFYLDVLGEGVSLNSGSLNTPTEKSAWLGL